MTFRVLEITKTALILILITGCASTSNEMVKVQPVSISNIKQTSSYPEWFVQQPQGLFGVGIAQYSAYSEADAFHTALNRAIEDLNSNALVVVTVEQFQEGASVHIFDEIAIQDVFTPENIVRIDSMICDNWIFYLVGTTPSEVSRNQVIMPDLAPVQLPESRIIAGNKTLVSMGFNSINLYNPYKGWALSKQEALKTIGQYTALKVQSSDRTFNEDLKMTRYFKSRILLKNARVSQRWIQNGQFFSLVEINTANIVNLTD